MWAADLKPASRSPLSSASPALMLPPSKTAGAPACTARATVATCGSTWYCTLDQAQRVLCLLFGGGRHGGDLVSLVHRAFARLENGERGLHSRRLLRLRQVDRDDAGVRVRRAQDLRVQLPRAIHVVRILGAARHLQRTVHARQTLAEYGGVLGLRPRVFRVLIGARRRLNFGDLVSHGPPPSSDRAPPRARACRSRTGRCCRRARRAPVPASDSDGPRAARRPT